MPKHAHGVNAPMRQPSIPQKSAPSAHKMTSECYTIDYSEHMTMVLDGSVLVRIQVRRAQS